jgi:hypothetical protein
VGISFHDNFLQLLTFIYPQTSICWINLPLSIMKKLALISLLSLALISWRQPGDWLVLNLKGYWKFTIGDSEAFAQPNYDDSEWDEIFVPSAWENEGYHGYDGYAWYRVGFELNTRTIDEESLYLDLGYIDDADEVYVNGVKVGFTGGFPPDFFTAYKSRRMYYLPNEILRKGETNIIAVRVFDTVLDGGILSGTIGVFSTNDRFPAVQQLEGIWKIRDRRNEDWRAASYDDDRWKETMVPGFWHEMKSWQPHGSIATYRKSFEFSPIIDTSEDLVLILGKIDDYDEVFFNGELIGKTKDYRPFGRSMSYSEFRVYDIPRSLINRTGSNTIVVEVEDIGGNAGIYQGPIMITYLEDYRRVIREYDNSWRW